MKLRIGAALVSAACAAGTALTATVLIAGPAGAATTAGQANLVATTTDLTMKVNGSTTIHTVAFDRQPTVELDFDTGNDGSVGITGTFTVFSADTQGNLTGTVCTNVPLQGFSQGSCNIPDGKLPVGTSELIAQYNGDDNNSASASPAATLTVTQEPTSAALGAVTSVAYGEESLEHFTVTPIPRTSGTPTGEFKVNSGSGTNFCDGQLVAGVGRCVLLDTKLTPGSYQFVGEYDGDSTFSPSISDTETITVTPGEATTTLSLSPSTIGFGQQQDEQMTVKIAPVEEGTPTGQATVMVGGTTLCAAAVPASGIFSCNLEVGQLPVGSYEVIASYDGDSNFAGSSSSHELLTIAGKSVATPSLTLSTSKVNFGQEQAVRFTANVTGQGSGITPSGTVTIKAGSATLCSFTLTSGQGHCNPTATKLSPGTYHVTASYSGDVIFGAASSASQTLTVAAAPTATSLTLSKAKVKNGQEQKETLTVAVQPKVKSSLTPGGRVTVKAGAAAVCVITLKKAKGTCKLTASQFNPGTYHLTAVYAGVSPFARSTSPAKTLTVTK